MRYSHVLFATCALCAAAMQQVNDRALALPRASDPAESAAKMSGGYADLAAPKTSDGRDVPLEGTSRISCTECHAEVVEEWSRTLHARAWVDETYREELEEVRRKESCHNCHIPEPLHVGLPADGKLPQKPAARDATLRDVPIADVDAHFGVSCETCHRGPDGTILGPYGAATEAHVSVKHASFLPESSSALCIACHATTVGPVIGIAKDFVDTEQAASGESCIGCHMAPVERPAAVEEGKPAHPSRPGRSHALQTPRDPDFLARAFRFTVERRGGAVVVHVANAASHRVPGRLGRTIEIEATLRDAAGHAVSTVRRAFVTKENLAANAEVELELPGDGVEVHIVGMHEAPALPATVRFLDRRLALP